VVANRTVCCARALPRVQVWDLVLGRDRERNWDALGPLFG
jgi:hypothetical protein